MDVTEVLKHQLFVKYVVFRGGFRRKKFFLDLDMHSEKV